MCVNIGKKKRTKRMKNYKVTRITEADFGCEELPPGEEVKALVFLEDEAGEVKRLEISDRYLIEQGIDEGKEVLINQQGMLKSIDGMMTEKNMTE